MAAPVNTPTKYTGATGFVEIALPTAQAKETDTLIHFVYKGAQHGASASGITSTNFVITDVSGTLLPSYLVTFTAYNNMELHLRFPNVSTSAAQYVYLQYGSGITRANDSAALTGDGFYHYFTLGDTSGPTVVDLCGTQNGTAVNSPTFGATGKVGNGVDFESSSSQSVEVASTMQQDAYTFKVWMNFESLFDFSGICSWRFPGLATAPFEITVGNSQIYISTISTKAGTGISKYWLHDAHGLSTATFYMISGTWDGVIGNAPVIYINGVAKSLSSSVVLSTSQTSNLRLANRNYITTYFDGILNSFGWINANKSANWSLRTYNNENGFATDAIFTVSTAFASSGVQLGPFSSYAFSTAFENGIWR